MGARKMAYRSWLSAVLISLVGLSLGCNELASTWLGTPPIPTPTAPSQGPIPSPSPSPTVPPPIVSATPMTLTVWTAVEFAPTGEALARQLEEFEAISLKVHVAIQPKGMEGKGGLVNLMTAAAPVAPSVLPDVAIVNSAQAAALAQQGLIHPWQDLLPPNLEEDLFPLARRLGYYEEQRMGVSVALDLQHLAYNLNEVPTPPLLWRDVLTGKALYLFPAMGKGDTLDTFLIQYLGAGGRLFDEEGSPLLEGEPLAAALARYQGAEIVRVVPSEALQLDSLAACWPLYLSGRVGMVHVWTSRYLAEQSKLQHTSFAPIPTVGETRITVGRGWLMVLVAKDPVRQEKAARFLSWWLAPQYNAALCRATGWLPPGHAAFAQWQGDDRYYRFLQGQLEVALPQPILSPPWAEALSGAIGQVLRGEVTAQEAAAQVMAVVSLH